MKMKDLLKYEDRSCRVKFNVESKKTGLGIEQDRTGYVKSVTMKIVVLYLLGDDNNEEIHIPIKDVNKITYL